MALLLFLKRCLRPRRVLWGLLSGLVTLYGFNFLATGGHEEMLSRSLPYLMSHSGHRPMSAPLLPTSEAFLLLPPPDACAPRAPSLLVVVTSAPNHTAQRQGIRDTWGGARWAGEYTIRTFFALGLPPEPSEQAALEQEAAQHGDLIQGRFMDTYRNLTLKTLALMGWATTCCPGALFLIKADDDMFLNLPALAQHLKESAGPTPAYLGRIHWWVRPNRDPHNRHHVPTSLYPEDVFPPYCSGATYILSGDSVAAILGAARHVPLLPIEDVFMGLCARQAGIIPRHLTRLSGSAHVPLDPCCYREVLFSVHQVAPAEMAALWDEVGPREKPCSPWQKILGLLRCKTLAWLG